MQKLLAKVFERKKPSGVKPIGVFRRQGAPARRLDKQAVRLDGRKASGRLIGNSINEFEKRRKEAMEAAWWRSPHSLSPTSLPLTLSPFLRYTDLQRPLANRVEVKELQE